MTVQTKPYLSPQEYLALERSAEYKSEYADGDCELGLSEIYDRIDLPDSQ